MQLYPSARATCQAKMIVGENLADHIDMNFPAARPRSPAGRWISVHPAKRRLFARSSPPRSAHDRQHRHPVTVSSASASTTPTRLPGRRVGSPNRRRRGRPACPDRRAVLRTADWDRIAELKQARLRRPRLGNGDIFQADDALAMMGRPAATASSSAAALPRTAVAVRRTVSAAEQSAAPQAGLGADLGHHHPAHCRLLITHYDHLEAAAGSRAAARSMSTAGVVPARIPWFGIRSRGCRW